MVALARRASFGSEARTISFYSIRLYQCTLAPVFALLWAVLTALPIYPDLLDMSGSGGNAWRFGRKFAGIEAPRSLPTMGWMWGRTRLPPARAGVHPERDPSCSDRQNRIYGSNCVVL